MAIYEQGEVITTHEESLTKLFIIETGEVTRLTRTATDRSWKERESLAQYENFGVSLRLGSRKASSEKTRVVAKRFTKVRVREQR